MGDAALGPEMFTVVCKVLTEEMTMGPEDQHEQPAEQDGYEKWLEERATAKLAKLLRPTYSQASELDADEWDAEHRKSRKAGTLDNSEHSK
jgi:hypothetical protein